MTERTKSPAAARHIVIALLVVSAFTIGLFSFFQATGSFADPDSFYHAKMAVLLRDEGIVRQFPWAHFTVLAETYADQHLLYHAFLIPFVTWFDPLIGTKVATVVLGAVLLCGFYLVLRSFHVRWPLLYTLLLLAINPFTFRMNLAKASSFSILILFIGLSLAAHYRWRWLAVVSFLYVWLYGGFALLFVSVSAYVAVSWFVNRYRHRQSSHRFLGKVYSVLGPQFTQRRRRHLNLRIWLSVVGGLAAGIILNPYWPKNLIVYLYQLVNIGIVNYRQTIGVGSEWYPYAFGDLMANTVIITVSVVVALLLFIIFFRKQSKISITAAVLWLFFLILTLKSRRYVEYYVPFAMFFSAVSISDALRDWPWHRLHGYVRGFWQSSVVGRTLLIVLGLMMAIGVPYVVGRDIATERRDHEKGFALDVYGPASRWLAANSPAGSIVVHDDWDEFPVLFYHNHHNYYIVGLDPTFMYLHDKDRYWQWVNITTGRYTGDVTASIRDTFRAGYVFVSRDHQAMDNLIVSKTDFPLIYEDDDARIYQVTNRQ